MTGCPVRPGHVCAERDRKFAKSSYLPESNPAPGTQPSVHPNRPPGPVGMVPASSSFASRRSRHTNDRAERQRRRLQENQAYAKNTNVKAFLSAIGKAEGGDYNLGYGGIKGREKDPHRVKNLSTHPLAGHAGSTPFGMYQITVPTWREMGKQKMGIKDMEREHQDLIAIEIIRTEGAIEDVVAGDLIKALPKVAGRWAALPQGPGKGNKYPKQPYTKYEEFVKYFEEAGGNVKSEATQAIK